MMLIASIAWSKIIHVPGDQPTIQGGIDATIDGDTVLVADGTYTGEGNKNLDFKGKAITVASENGPENCIIDCEGDGMGFFFHSGEDSSSVLGGFTITNSSETYGGGIKCEGSSPTIENNNIFNSFDHGIAIVSGSSPIITNNRIQNNALNGLDIWNNANPEITHNVIVNNGHGIQVVWNCFPVIWSNTFEGNDIGITCNDGASPIIGGSLEHANDFLGDNFFAVEIQDSTNINANYNYWGTVVEVEIQAVIYDYYDDPNLGIVDYDPWTNETHDQILGTGSIKGHITYCQTGDPIKWALVIALQKPTKISKFTDKDGDYGISDLEPGGWWLIGIKKGYKPHIAKVEVKAGEPTTHDFCLEPK